MAHESFEDPATAALMNELFVNVKVDREERPDVDSLYMDAVVALTGSGGWPMTVFLTPDGEPFLGGTYFPPEPRHGLPSFREVLALGRGDVPRAARRRHAPGAGADRLRARVGATRGVARAADEHRCCTRRCAGSAPASTSAGAAGAARRSSRRRRRSSSCCGATSSSLRRRRSTGWRSAACTTCSAAASTATRSTSAGSCRTSRRCSTTTRCSSPRTCTAGS